MFYFLFFSKCQNKKNYVKEFCNPLHETQKNVLQLNYLEEDYQYIVDDKKLCVMNDEILVKKNFKMLLGHSFYTGICCKVVPNNFMFC